MLKKTITFEDFDGNKRTEDFYFHLKQSDVIKLLTTSGDYTLDKVWMRLSTERNGKKIMDIIENIIKMSYGKKSIDGRKFEQTDEIWNDFYQTEAYSILFTELITDAKAASDFVNGIIPKNLSDGIEDILKNNPEGIPDEMRDYIQFAAN